MLPVPNPEVIDQNYRKQLFRLLYQNPSLARLFGFQNMGWGAFKGMDPQAFSGFFSQIGLHPQGAYMAGGSPRSGYQPPPPVQPQQANVIPPTSNSTGGQFPGTGRFIDVQAPYS